MGAISRGNFPAPHGVHPWNQQNCPATRRALILLAVLPAWQTAAHLSALAIVVLIAAEISLIGCGTVPFACSCLPGKSRFHRVLLGAVALAHGAIPAVLFEHKTVQQPLAAATPLAVLAILYAALRGIAKARPLREPRDEEEAAPAVQKLGLA